MFTSYERFLCLLSMEGKFGMRSALSRVYDCRFFSYAEGLLSDTIELRMLVFATADGIILPFFGGPSFLVLCESGSDPSLFDAMLLLFFYIKSCSRCSSLSRIGVGSS